MNDRTKEERFARLGREIQRAMEWLGWIVFWLWIFASLDFIDFHVCLKAVGECHP